MQVFSASDMRNNFSKAVDIAQREPVVIRKQGRDVAVMISTKDYERITRDNIEDYKEFARRVGEKAVARGLTEAKLKKLLEE